MVMFFVLSLPWKIEFSNSDFETTQKRLFSVGGQEALVSKSAFSSACLRGIMAALLFTFLGFVVENVHQQVSLG